MRVASLAIAFREERFIRPHLNQMPDWVDESLVLVSKRPWNGEPEPEADSTGQLAKRAGATVLEYDWKTEQDQRNSGLEYLSDYDWVVMLDPDEFLDSDNWDRLYKFMEGATGDAYVAPTQTLYWKSGYRIEPAEPHNGIILVKPSVRFFDNRCVDANWSETPIHIHHLSWARTDDEMWRKINHYGHANDFDKRKWFNEKWLAWTADMANLHPVHPEVMPRAVPADMTKLLELSIDTI